MAARDSRHSQTDSWMHAQLLTSTADGMKTNSNAFQYKSRTYRSLAHGDAGARRHRRQAWRCQHLPCAFCIPTVFPSTVNVYTPRSFSFRAVFSGACVRFSTALLWLHVRSATQNGSTLCAIRFIEPTVAQNFERINSLNRGAFRWRPAVRRRA